MSSSLIKWLSTTTVVVAVLFAARGATDDALGLHSGPGGWGFFPANRLDPKLPRVLLVGDSVMNGYRAEVSRLLAGRASVDAWTTGMHLANTDLITDLRTVLKQGPYDVIHFNIGLHDWPEGRIPKGQYGPLLEYYVSTYISNAPTATLIWASSTPVTLKGAKTLDPQINPIILRQNEIAEGVIQAHGLEKDDLYSLGVGHLSLMRGDQFHWTPAGTHLMAEQVARYITSALDLRAAPEAENNRAGGAAGEFHVAPGGNDANPGTKEQPFATLERARDAARQAKGATILLHGGTFELDKTLELTPADSGLTLRAFENEKPVLSGGRGISGWRKLSPEPAGVADSAKGKLWVADIPKGWCFHYLFVDGKPLPRARLHNTHWRKWPTDFTRGEPTRHGQLVTFKNRSILENTPANGDVEMVCIMAQYGVMGNGVLTQINPEAGTAVWNSTQTHLGFRTRDPNRYTLENALPFIDQPGEWCVDSTAGKVYCWPPSGSLEKSQVIAPKLYELVRLQGDAAQQKWVENVTLSGFMMICTDRLPEDKWPENWIRRQWEHVDAMIFIEGAKDCVISGNRLLHSGSSGITLNQFCQGIRVEGNEIGWPGSDGIFLCGYGPGELDVNKNNMVTRNWIHDLGQGNYWHSAAIQIYQSGHNQITLNLLQRSAYCCISIVGSGGGFFNDPRHFFQDDPVGSAGQFNYWSMFQIRTDDFPKEMQAAVRAGKNPFNRENSKPYLHSNENLIEYNIVVQPEQILDEGGAIYAYWTGKGNVWRNNLVFKSSGMPGSSVLALDDVAEYFTVTGNVIWVNGSARCGTIGMRPAERGNMIHDNIRASFKPEHADGPSGNRDGIKAGFYTTDPTREPVYKLQKVITDKVNAAGGWPGNPDTGIPRPGEEITDAVQRTLPKDSHMTIE